MLHGVASTPGGAIEVTRAADTFVRRHVAARPLGGAVPAIRAFRADADRTTRRLLGVGAIDVGQAFHAEAALGVAVRLHRLAGRAIDAARDAAVLAGVADLRCVALGVDQTFGANETLDVAVRLGPGAIRIGKAFHACAAWTADLLGATAVGVGQTFDARRGGEIAIGRRGRTFAISGTRLGRFLRTLGGVVADEIDRAGVAHGAIDRAADEGNDIGKPCREAKRALPPSGQQGENGRGHAIHPYRYK